MKMRYIILFAFIFCASHFVNAQSVKFTADTSYIKELGEFLQKSNKEEVMELFTQFTNKWNTGPLTLPQKSAIITVSNNLIKKRARIFPHFYNYMKYILSVLNSERIASQFNTWHGVFEKYTQSKSFNTSELNKLFEKLMMLNDSSALFESRAVLWKYTNNNYRLEYDLKGQVRIYFSNTDLECFSKRDSSLLIGTNGYYYPLKDMWFGENGTVTWERAGFSKDSVFAKLNNYRINLTRPEFIADSAEFINKGYLNQALVGRFEEKILANARGEKASYPRFTSYDKQVDIKHVVPDVDYSGGFEMRGSKFFGYGDAENKAELFFYKGNDVFTRAKSITFVFDENSIRATNVAVQIILEEDTLWHPGLSFNYLIKNKRIALTRAGGGLYRSNFYNTYHNLEVDINEISYQLEDTLIYFKSPPATTYRKAIFNSINYFTEDDYDRIKMMDNVHPLEAVRYVSPAVGETFEAKDLAHYLGKPESSCVTILLRLSDEGFVHFDPDTRIGYPKQKLFDYIKANYKKKDYDEILIVSEPDTGSNAILNLNNYELAIYGVKPFPLSNNRRVGIIPKDSKITVKEDLGINFDGKLQAGLARIYGEKLNFNYDSFFVNLSNVDSVRLYCRSKEKNQDSLYEYAQVSSTVDSVVGLLRIDVPANKSGVETYPTYPVFESHEKSFVFYDQKGSKDTVYKKEDFYFENYPFEIDSLNNITKDNLQIAGIFKSGGVFPDFEEKLIVQPDSSLGFVHNLGDDGMEVYGGLGIYNNTITLDGKGLRGDGKVTFLNTELYSQQFDFYPDSMNTYARSVKMNRQANDSLTAKYPEGYNDSVFVHWEPQRDQMFLTSLNEPYKMFEDKAKFQGTLKLQPKDLGGKGTLTFLDANLKSDTYTFFDESFTADTADFKLQPEPGQESPFLTYNVNADVDFTKKLGMFKSNGDSSYIEFPVNQYKCFMNYFSWHMGINQIDIGVLQGLHNDSISNVASLDSIASGPVQDDMDLYNVELTDTSYTAEEIAERSKFLSTHPEQDSLSFYAVSSSYDINNFIIKANGVKFITIADAHIFPASAMVIEPNAKIQPLNGARIVADRTTRYHTFFDATINVLGAKQYTASADYEYIDRLDSMQIIHFDDIRVENKAKTIAEGRISEKDYFKLGPEFAYFGQTKILADQRDINFEGYTQIQHFCEARMPSYWLKFAATINPDSIIIPIEEQPRDNELRKLQSSIYVTNDSMGVYSSFLTTKQRFSDQPVLTSKGYLYYNDTTGYYEITDSAKFVNRELDGNYLSFHKKLCLVMGEGKMDLGADLGQVKVTPVGAARQNLDSWKTRLNVMLGVDFFFNDAALNAMAEVFNSAYSLPPVDLTSKEYQLSFKELVGLERAKQYNRDFGLLGGFSSVPDEMNKTLFFSQVTLKWNHYHRAWVSDGKIGVGNLKNNQVIKFVDGFIEVKKSRGGDILNIYLEIDPKTWFFFTYTRGTLKTISSSDDYNNYVVDLKDKDRKSPNKDSDTPFMFFPATERAKDNFVNEMKKRLQEGDTESDINLDNYTTRKSKKSEEVEQETEEEEPFFVEEEEQTEEVLIEVEEIKEEGQNENIKTETKKEETKTVTEEGKKEETKKTNDLNKTDGKKKTPEELKKEAEKKKKEVKKEEKQEEEIKYEEEEEEEGGIQYEEEEEEEG
jgi:hypothetical protein